MVVPHLPPPLRLSTRNLGLSRGPTPPQWLDEEEVGTASLHRQAGAVAVGGWGWYNPPPWWWWWSVPTVEAAFQPPASPSASCRLSIGGPVNTGSLRQWAVSCSCQDLMVREGGRGPTTGRRGGGEALVGVEDGGAEGGWRAPAPTACQVFSSNQDFTCLSCNLEFKGWYLAIREQDCGCRIPKNIYDYI